MKKDMKKIPVIILLLTVCLVFSACSSPSGNSNSNLNNDNPEQPADGISKETAEISTESYYDTLGERDFGGDTFTILDANAFPDICINFPLEEGINGDPVNDALYMRDSLIEEKYGINIEYIQIIGGGCQTLEKSVRAGENAYDMIVSSVYGTALDNLSMNNILYNLADAPYLSLQSPWWNKMMYNNMQFNGKFYYTGGDIFLPSYSIAPAAVMFNKKIMQDYNITENLYNLVFEGKWTIDVYENLIKDMNIDLNQDGKMNADDDFFGTVNLMDDTNTVLWLAGLGFKFSTVSGNTINVDLASSDNINKIDRLTDMLKQFDYKDGFDLIEKTFKSGRSLFLSHAMQTPQLYLRDMEDDYGILSMPKWNESQETYISALNPWASGFVAVPQNAEIEKSAFLMEAMGYAGYEMLRPAVYDITLKAKGARDEESERIIDIIIETSFLDINSVYNFGGTINILNDAVMNKKPFISAYEKKEGEIQKDIDKFIETVSAEN